MRCTVSICYQNEMDSVCNQMFDKCVEPQEMNGEVLSLDNRSPVHVPVSSSGTGVQGMLPFGRSNQIVTESVNKPSSNEEVVLSR
jgi:hypothetical protein